MRRTSMLPMAGCICSAFVHAQVKNNSEVRSSEVAVTAGIIGGQHEIEELRSMSAAERLGEVPANAGWQLVYLRQEIYTRVLLVSMQVDATTAQIDNEIAQANELHGYLADRRDRSVNRSNLLSALIGGGMGSVSAGLQLPAGQTKPSAIVGIAGGAIASSLAVAGIRAHKGGTRLIH